MKKPTLPLKSTLTKVAAVVVAVIVVAGLSFAGGWLGAGSRMKNLNQAQQREVVSSESELISSIAKELGPSVVSVNTTKQSNNPFAQFFGQSDEVQGAGTGFIVSDDGVVVTNRHVVPEGTTAVSVTLSDGTELNEVSVIGRTSESDTLDIAFLKINNTEDKQLVPAKLGDSADMEVGDKVVAIGNALGQFQNTVTSGIISGYGRDVEAGSSSGLSTESLQDLFQTDAAINQGNSGGPLVNMNGEVIGINTAVAGGTAQNIGFAIPMNDVASLIRSVIRTGKLERPYLGVRYVSITDDYANVYNLPVKRGAYILPETNGNKTILDGSPAQIAGLQPKDIITRINGVAIDDNNNLSSVLARFEVGQRVTMTILRDGQQQEVSVVLTAAPTN